jgi:hypothetical protein
MLISASQAAGWLIGLLSEPLSHSCIRWDRIIADIGCDVLHGREKMELEDLSGVGN